MILACDGLWDVFGNQRAIEFARSRLREHNNAQQCSEELVSLRVESCAFSVRGRFGLIVWSVPLCIWCFARTEHNSSSGAYPSCFFLQVAAALQMHSADNVTVVTVCFSPRRPPPRREFSQSRLRSLSTEGLNTLSGLLNRQ